MPDTGFRLGYSRIGDHQRTIDYKWLAGVIIAILGVMVSGALIAVLVLKEAEDDTLLEPQLKTDFRLNDNQDFLLLKRPRYRDDEAGVENNFKAALPEIPSNVVISLYQKALEENSNFSYSNKNTDSDVCNMTTSAADFFRYHNEQRHSISTDLKFSHVQERTVELLKNKYKLSNNQIRHGMYSDVTDEGKPFCRKSRDKKLRPTTICRKDQLYRTFDGTCNNLRRPSWGAADTPYRRGLPPDYADGISKPRASALDGLPLPDARLVSTAFHSSKNTVEDSQHSTLTSFWGQFVAHDITKVKPNLESNNCCLRNSSNDGSMKPESECFPIKIPENDEFYSAFNITCLDFVRSMPADRDDCSLGPREQVNQVTSFLDGSVIYGSSLEESKELRTFQNGFLKTERIAGEIMLPTLISNTSYCAHKTVDSFCFIAGEARCNENLILTSLHTLFVRQHNRLATQLLELNVGWDDERTFQEARRILVAQLQHITYSEYLPRLLGTKIMKGFSVGTTSEKKSLGPKADKYDPMVNPTINNEFATAAFRFGHATIPGLTQLLSGKNIQLFQLHRGLFSPDLLTRDNDTYAQLVNGAVSQPALRVDPYVSRQLTNHLFETSNAPGSGLDLVAINIQRGRDHGLPGYNAFRTFCGLPAINTTDGYMLVFDTVAARTFAQLYKSVDDLDLFVGGLAEPSRVPDGMLGPVLACIVGEQFARLRQGDRFWYENDAQSSHPLPFNEDQLSEIRSTTLARIICDNVPGIRNIQPDVFRTPLIGSNQPESCTASVIRSLDINYWEENDSLNDLLGDDDTDDSA